MPEYPDIEVYRDCLEPRVVGRPLSAVRLASPFLLRTVQPSLDDCVGRSVLGVRRLGKRLVFSLQGDLFLILHLMIAGRLRWKAPGAPIPGRVGLAAFDFATGSAVLTEAAKKKRAKLHVVRGEAAVAEHDPGGMEVVGSTLAAFAERLRLRNHTVKRALTDPRLFSGIGNAYSDEILFEARLSPVKLTQKLDDATVERLHGAIVAVLTRWHRKLRDEVGEGFPDKVTAFHPDMAVHGRYKQDCRVCGQPIQRIRYASNEANYCARCQNADRLLADRGLSRLMKNDWPKTLEQLEEKTRSSL